MSALATDRLLVLIIAVVWFLLWTAVRVAHRRPQRPLERRRSHRITVRGVAPHLRSWADLTPEERMQDYRLHEHDYE